MTHICQWLLIGYFLVGRERRTGGSELKLEVEGAMQVSIQPPGADPCDRMVRNPGPPTAVRPGPDGTKPWPRAGSALRSRPRGSHVPWSRPRGGYAPWPRPRAFGIGTGLAAWWGRPHHGAAVGEAGPPGYARHPDYLVHGIQFPLRTLFSLGQLRTLFP